MVLTALNGGSKPEEGTVAERRDRYTRINRMSRRDFLRRSAGAALAVPSMAAILAACSKPTPTGGDGSPLPSSIPIATRDNPVTLPLRGQPVATDAPVEEGTLQIYNWIDYMWKQVLNDWKAQADRELGVHDVQHHGGGGVQARVGQGQARRLLPDHRQAPHRGVRRAPAAARTTNSSRTSPTIGRSSAATSRRGTTRAGATRPPTRCTRRASPTARTTSPRTR